VPTFVLPCVAASVPAARRSVRGVLAGWGARDDAVETAVLLTDELVTNALLHARTDILLEVSRHGETIRVVVQDGSPTMPRQRRRGRLATHGRGLALVAELARDWGVSAEPAGGKQVWFELLLHAAVVPTGAGHFTENSAGTAGGEGWWEAVDPL